MSFRRTMAGLVMVSALLACGGDPNDPVINEATPEPLHTPIDHRCEDPDPDLLERLAGGLDVDAELVHPRQVESEALHGVAFIAAELVGEDLDDEPPIGTWAVIGEGADAELHAVSAVARYHSSWPDGTRRDDPFTMTTDGAEEAERCVEGSAG